MSWGGSYGGSSNPGAASSGPSTGSGVKKLHYIGIFKKTADSSAAVKLCADAKLDEYGRFTKGSALEMLTLLARTTAKTAPDSQHQSVDLSSESMFQGKPVKIHSWVRLLGGGGSRQQRIVGVAITEGWPKDVAAHQFIKRVVGEFLDSTPLADVDAITTTDATFAMPKPQDDTRSYLEIGQDPAKFDAVTQIQDQLDETKILLNKTIESVLVRGEKLDDLVAKSDNLSASSKLFYKQAKKQNSCCILM